MEAKFDPKAKVKQGQFSDAPDGKNPNREHTNIDFSQHTHRKQELGPTSNFIPVIYAGTKKKTKKIKKKKTKRRKPK